MALEDSGLVIDDELALRAGCAIGSGIGGLCRKSAANYQMYIDRGARRISCSHYRQYRYYGLPGQLSIAKNLRARA